MSRLMVSTLLALWVSTTARAQFVPPAELSSVVRITCRYTGGEAIGTGFAYGNSTSIVTALHVVAGCTQITAHSETAKDEVEAEVVRVLREADLALLRLSKDLKLRPVRAGAVGNLMDSYIIWGYPKSVRTAQGDPVRFSLSGEQPTLAKVMSESQYRSALGAQGYPLMTTRILRVSDTILPGHSGSPIFDKSGVVIGIGDGGLHQGINRLNWAIPAAGYLEQLMKSTDAKPSERPRSAVQFSTDAAPPSDVSVDFGDGELDFAGTASLVDILETADPDDAEEAASLFEELRKEQGVDLKDALIDVWEDYATGATIAVPNGVTLEFDAKRRLLTASIENGGVTMYVQINPDGGEKSKDDFEADLDDIGDWEQDPDEADEYEAADGVRHWLQYRVGDDDSIMLTDLTIDDEDQFLGVALVIDDVEKLRGNAKKIAFVMRVCLNLTAFAIN